jgi:hypothetical protein
MASIQCRFKYSCICGPESQRISILTEQENRSCLTGIPVVCSEQLSVPKERTQMTLALKMLRMLQWGMLASILLFVFVGEVASRSTHRIDPSLTYLFTTLGVAVVGVIFVVRRTLVLRAEESLVVHPDDNISLNHWKTGFLVTYALCEGLALVGLVQRVLGASLQQSAPYYLGGFILLFFFRPRQPARA